MTLRPRLALAGLPALLAVLPTAAAPRPEPVYLGPLDVRPRHFSTDPSMKRDYPIVYVRAPRRGYDKGAPRRDDWAEIRQPLLMNAEADLMLLRPDGSEERLVEGGADGAIADPCASFDGEWVYYAHVRGLGGITNNEAAGGHADLFKVHVPSRQVVRLTDQSFTPSSRCR